LKEDKEREWRTKGKEKNRIGDQKERRGMAL
jgi:hypothetical protein